MTHELDRHEKFDDGSELQILHNELWSWRDGEGEVHDDYWPTKEQAQKEVNHILAEMEKWEQGIDTGYSPHEYPPPIVVVSRTTIAAISSSGWKVS